MTQKKVSNERVKELLGIKVLSGNYYDRNGKRIIAGLSDFHTDPMWTGTLLEAFRKKCKEVLSLARKGSTTSPVEHHVLDDRLYGIVHGNIDVLCYKMGVGLKDWVSPKFSIEIFNTAIIKALDALESEQVIEPD